MIKIDEGKFAHATKRTRCQSHFQIPFRASPEELILQINCVDLFCGAGGLTHGLRRAGINVTAGIDLDESCRFAYEHNNAPARFFAADVAAVDGDILCDMFPKLGIRLLAGCAPCQPFSTYSLGKTQCDDHRWSLLSEFQRIVDEMRPEVITIENVPKLRTHAIFAAFVKKLRGIGYSVSYSVVDCTLYGVPQKRKRLVLLASLLGEIELRKPGAKRDRRKTVRHAIGKLPSIKAGECSGADRLHRASMVTALNMRRLKASVPGGSWRDWSPDLVAKCHTVSSGETFPGVYGRMSWDEPAPTITTQFYGFGNGRFGHPEQDRALSLREGAILQSFPARYRFVAANEKLHFTTIGQMIGNAVPVRLGQVIGESIVRHIETALKANRRAKR